MSSPSNSIGDQADNIPPDVKKDDKTENEKKENDVAEQSPKKEEKVNDNEKKSTLAKKPSKKEGEDRKDMDDSEDSSDEEVGLLDRPVEVSGSRERKKVQRLELSFTTTSKDKHEIPEGNGEKLGDCPRIEYQIQKMPVDELKPLHKILFSRPGSGNEIKKNIKKFSGFTFAKGTAEYDRKKAVIEKLTSSILKHVCEVLDLERSGTKEDITSRILDFLLEPKPSGKQVPKSKKKTSGKGVKRKHTEKKGGKNVTNKKKKNADTSDDDMDSPVDEESDIDDDNEDEDVTDEEPKKKKSKPSASKKNETQSKQKKNEKVKKVEEKKNTPKSAKRKKAAVKPDNSSSDDEPLLKKAAKSPPTDNDIKLLVKRILRGADLQEITMKKVIKQVFDEFPDFDLSDKKDYIKTTVKSVIS